MMKIIYHATNSAEDSLHYIDTNNNNNNNSFIPNSICGT
ncbi:unnamed protein product, partial [Trichobilharzia regenti]